LIVRINRKLLQTSKTHTSTMQQQPFELGLII
jgi:hypothetical protein